MRNPLLKRLPREFTGDFARNVAVFLFLSIFIGFISGYLVAGNSMIKSYDQGVKKYKIEHGHFQLKKEADRKLLDKIEEEGIKTSAIFNMDLKLKREKKDLKLRIFKDRKSINKISWMKGRAAKRRNEIALDRLFAKNNKIKLKDTITLEGRKMKVVGFVALSDYSSLFQENSDMMFDSIKFGVGVVTDSGMASFNQEKLKYTYAWLYDKKPENVMKEKDKADELLKTIVKESAIAGNQVKDFLPGYANQATSFARKDLGQDKSLVMVIMYLLIVIIAFVFAVTTSNMISAEAGVIGTLRASGYSVWELFRHYISLPVFITLFAAIAGNVAGYTVFKDIVAELYYSSYSLTKYETYWNEQAFVFTTLIPLGLMIAVNSAFIGIKLRHSPLDFLRRDIGSKRHRRAVRLPDFKFFSRFRLRIIFQNKASYIILFVGITFSSMLLLFSMMMMPLLNKFQDDILNTMPAKYQYILKHKVDTRNNKAEKYCTSTLETKGKEMDEDITIYGIKKSSRYLNINFPKKGVIISDGYRDKYGLDVGDNFVLKEKYENKNYHFKVAGIKKYPAALSVFMPIEKYREEFDKDKDYYNAYFSNKKLNDIDEDSIFTTITKTELTKITRQLRLSMGGMFIIIRIFSMILAGLLIYMLSKLIIEKNANSISMAKILGYTNGEIAKLYIAATTFVVVLSSIISMEIAEIFVYSVYNTAMARIRGWLTIYIEKSLYLQIMVIIVAVYAGVALLQFVKIKRIKMDQALKNVE